MKNMIRIASVALVCVMLVCMLASCGNKPYGAYEAKVELFGQSVSTTYDFKGSNVEITVKTTVLGTVNTEVSEAKYEIHETADGLEITFITEKDGEEQKSTYTYKKGEGFIKIADVEYTKVEK
jgi:major membrane immunogen (membrane-anchored lipoprotein)